MSREECFSDKEIRDFFHGRLTDGELELAIDEHIFNKCAGCRTYYNDLYDDDNPDIDDD